jgi:tetratricopeptide (TPR) repeat protein
MAGMSFPFKSPVIVSFLGLIALFAVGLLGFFTYRTYTTQSGIDAAQRHREPILISGVKEPKEMLVEPLPVYVPTARDRMLGEALESGDTASRRRALDRVIAKYPDYPDAYVMLLGILCNGHEIEPVVSDLNNALKFMDRSRPGLSKLFGSLLSMRAKIEHANGDYSAAMNDLETAINSDLGKAIEFANSGGIAPEKTASVCTWTEPDLDALVQRFATDYRAYMFRALYHGSFLFFDLNDKTKRESLNRTFDDLDTAARLNPGSALPHFFKAEIFVRTYALQMMSAYDPQRDELNRILLGLLNDALAVDPNNVWALKERALAYFHLEKWHQAIADHDRVFALDPKDLGNLNDRAETKLRIGDAYGAISDLNEVVKNKERAHSPLGEASNDTLTYEARADAYIKTRQWELAIRDLTTAISLHIGTQVLLANIDQFRALYPEYGPATDDAIARKLQQTFQPNMKYEDFAQGFLRRSGSFGFPDFVLADVFIKRLDAYLRAGNWRAAKADFRRAQRGYLNAPAAIDRWREIDPTENAQIFVDMKTFDDSRSDSINIWIKQTRSAETQRFKRVDTNVESSSDTGPYSLQEFELNCTVRQIRAVSVTNYDASGQLMTSHEGGKWNSVVPESFGETIYNGVCR